MEKLDDKIRISALLQKLLEQRVLLTVKLENHATPFSSAVIEVNRDGDFIILDELKPEAGNELISKNPSLQLQGAVDGVTLGFAAKVSEFGQEDGICFYKLPIPEQAEYHQRRQAVRVKVSAANPLAVTFTDNNGTHYDGDIEDLSIGGLRARFGDDLPHSLETGMELNCAFLIPPDNKEKLNSRFIVRVVKHEKDGQRPAFLGGQFLGLEKQLERKLQRAIMTLQRASRQKQAF
ncbi:hypothetical protein Tel_05400 [Candidatus Tenderia electrophaga]|jgi:c-di-GMP-binding flagellar brake protein YcgR|uniref:Flagellar brake protein YcgR n=1 Tax=Candidatus Tenderia electrophaga TaxID=1748243 RepID=A0A0S2TBZ5_9GAMM|nr:hypothetical protein Tel_05400 [Candidatus Tenderia electrophaga]